jgi:hypothetical protein
MPMESKRPLLITIFCIVGFIGAVFVALGLFIPAISQSLAQQYGASFIVVTFISLVLGLAGLIGMWLMRKWGVYAYTAMAVLSIGYGLIAGLSGGILSYIIPVVVVITGFAYLKRMD